MSAPVGRGAPRQSSRAKAPGHAPAYVMLALLLASPALAQGVDVTASLDITDGLARVGAYAPVTFTVTNRTDKEIAEVFVTTGGPVDVRCEWRLAPGETDTKVLPVFYAGADLALTLDFFDADGAAATRAKVTPTEMRPIPDGTALVGLAEDFPGPDEALRARLGDMLGAKSLHLRRLSAVELAAAARSGVLDVIADSVIPAQPGAAILVIPGVSDEQGIVFHPFARHVQDAVQPAAYRLLGSEVWPVAERVRLWLWLTLFGLGVLAVGVLTPRRRLAAPVVALVVLGLGGAAVIWLCGDVRLARVREARIFYARVPSKDPEPLVPLEQLVLLQSRGGETARFHFPWRMAKSLGPGPALHKAVQAHTGPLPFPVFATSQDLFRSHGVVAYGLSAEFESREPRLVLHALLNESCPFGHGAEEVTHAELEKVARQPDLIQALLVQGAHATDASGRSQTLDAWAVEWQGSEDPNVAYAGQSLKWWDGERREGDGPFLLAWFHDPLPEGAGDGGTRERLPALVVYGDAPTQE